MLSHVSSGVLGKWTLYGSLRVFYTCHISKGVREVATVRFCPSPMLWLPGNFLSVHRAGMGSEAWHYFCILLYNYRNIFVLQKKKLLGTKKKFDK